MRLLSISLKNDYVWWVREPIRLSGWEMKCGEGDRVDVERRHTDFGLVEKKR